MCINYLLSYNIFAVGIFMHQDNLFNAGCHASISNSYALDTTSMIFLAEIFNKVKTDLRYSENKWGQQNLMFYKLYS